jgi:hypothetical protein
MSKPRKPVITSRAKTQNGFGSVKNLRRSSEISQSVCQSLLVFIVQCRKFVSSPHTLFLRNYAFGMF